MHQHDNTQQSLTTRPFKLSRSCYERYVAARWLGSRGIWLVVIPIAAAFTTAIAAADVRWVLIALMYTFIIAPGTIAMAYFRYLLTPEARLNALLKSLTIIPGHSINVHYEMTPDAETALPPDETIQWSELTAIRPWGKYLVVELHPSPHPRFIIVPREAIDPSDLPAFSKSFASNHSNRHK